MSTYKQPHKVLDLSLKHRYPSRLRERQIRAIFRFLDLPGEIRNIIYDLCVDVSAPQKLIARYYDEVRDTTDIRKVEAPMVFIRTPHIFLINRQILTESRIFLRKRGLTFDHGLLDLADVTDFVKPGLLGNISSLTIDDTGHNLFQDNILAASWIGYMVLIQQLAGFLSKGHKLKTLKLIFDSPELVAHVTTCWHGQHTCGFRDHLRKTCEALRAVRNVGNVTLRGLPEPLGSDLKARMESAPISFFDLPGEIRNMIYSEALDWSDCSKQLARTMLRWSDKTASPPYPARSTPTVLLLNRQITAEALEILREKPLKIVCPQDHTTQKQAEMPNMLKLITPATLVHVRHLEIDIQSWQWVYSFDHFLPVFASATSAVIPSSTARIATHDFTAVNAAVHSLHQKIALPTLKAISQTALKTLKFRFTDNLKSSFLRDPTQQYPDSTLRLTLNHLAHIRGLEQASFVGDLPDCYTLPLAQIMQTPAHVDEAALPRLQVIKCRTGEAVDADE
ncbi:hypothetical protein LTR53_015446 [Teratosphaeriaceae sp. CCFEE 6253]|nr:hypothetical protein LTR53_015446 [Teratosphaeriaceae sp. CCFEE 6253]